MIQNTSLIDSVSPPTGLPLAASRLPRAYAPGLGCFALRAAATNSFGSPGTRNSVSLILPDCAINECMRWSFPNPDPAQIEALRAEAKVSPLIARLLFLRGITAANALRYLSPSLNDLHSPYLMHGMSTAIERISAAIANREGILIYGDYDVDGTSAVVILKTAIELCGGAADFHVPHRIKEGYGIKDDVIERAA